MVEPVAPTSAQTVIGLFDDQIDAEHALAALRKRAPSASNVSVLALDRVVGGKSGDSPIDVTRAVMDTALTTMSGWLSGLAALLVPDHGLFVAAGPIGVMLARMKRNDETADSAVSDTPTEAVGTVGQALEVFGFPPEESYYLEQRVGAGSALLAVTDRDDDRIEATLRTFADFNAVFIGQAETQADVLQETERWLANPLAVETNKVIIADVVAALRSVRQHDGLKLIGDGYLGRAVIESDDSDYGTVDDLLIDPVDDSRVRYLIVTHGEIFGLLKRRVAIPADSIADAGDKLRVSVEPPVRLSDAPAYDPATPFSRKDELAACEFFHLQPYWMTT